MGQDKICKLPVDMALPSFSALETKKSYAENASLEAFLKTVPKTEKNEAV